MKATFKAVNAAIAAKGYKAELIKGAGYFYFVGDDVRIDAPSTYTYRLTDFTVEEWMAEFAACVDAKPASTASLIDVLNDPEGRAQVEAIEDILVSLRNRPDDAVLQRLLAGARASLKASHGYDYGGAE